MDRGLEVSRLQSISADEYVENFPEALPATVCESEWMDTCEYCEYQKIEIFCCFNRQIISKISKTDVAVKLHLLRSEV